MIDWRHDLRGAAILGGAFVGLVVIAELWSRLGKPKPETTRKFVHIGGGIGCLFFPFLVKSPYVVLAMAVLLSAVFALGQRLRFLPSLHGVSRRSRGTEYYPLAIFLVFLMGRDRPWLYVPSVLVLTVSDSLAALIGSKYGLIRYEVEREKKSLEGSFVFLASAFVAMCLPLHLLGALPLAVCVLSATLVAVLVTGFEAISLRGTDNLFVPLAVFVILEKITSKPMGEIIYQNISLAAMCIFIGLAAWRTHSFNVGGSIVFMLYAFATWSLGSEWWALPVFMGFAVYVVTWLTLPPAPEDAAPIRVTILTRALLPCFAVLVAANATGEYGFCFAPYLTAGITVMAFALWNQILWRRPPGWRRAFETLLIGLLSWSLIGVATWLCQEFTGSQVAPQGRVLIAVGAASVPLAYLDNLLMRDAPPVTRGRPWPAWRFVMTCAAAAVVSGLQLAGVVPAWKAV